MAVCSVDPGDPCESVDGPPVCSVKAIVVQRGNHHEAAAGSILITPLRAQHAMASASAPPLQLLQAVPAQLAYHLEGDPRAQALSHQLSDVDTELGFRFFTDERRSWVMSLPTESGETVLNALCASGLRDEADLAMRLQTHCRQRWHVLARFLVAKTTPVQFCIGSGSGGSDVSEDSPMPEKLEAIPAWYEEQWESKFRSPQRELKNLNEAALRLPYPAKVQMPPPQYIGGYTVVGERRRCRVCGKNAKKMCSNCKDVRVKQYYCGEKCQNMDWLGHWQVCGHRVMIYS